jgi:hypothetical protein
LAPPELFDFADMPAAGRQPHLQDPLPLPEAAEGADKSVGYGPGPGPATGQTDRGLTLLPAGPCDAPAVRTPEEVWPPSEQAPVEVGLAQVLSERAGEAVDLKPCPTWSWGMAALLAEALLAPAVRGKSGQDHRLEPRRRRP